MEKQSRAKECLENWMEIPEYKPGVTDNVPDKRKLKEMNHKTIEDVKGFHDGLTTHTFDHVGWEGVEFILKSDLTELEKLKI